MKFKEDMKGRDKMSGITLRQILSCMDMFETVKLEDEFGNAAYWNNANEMIERVLSDEQLDTAFEYIRTEDGEIVLGISRDHYEMFRDLYEA